MKKNGAKALSKRSFTNLTPQGDVAHNHYDARVTS